MRIAYLFPTVEEATPFLLRNPKALVFVTGVGPAAVAAATVRAVKAKKPHLMLLCGVAGAYDTSLNKGEVVEVVQEQMGELPERYRECYALEPLTELRTARSNTVTRCGGEAAGAEVEQMEGAAFFAVCEAFEVEAAQIRAISNYVGEPREEWCFAEAVENLAEILSGLNFEEE
ncbi:MAG: hypothetical protein IJX56_02285 [Alistipes sp.]|nr:hypothetical protein [Alistipes sp.]